MISRELASRGWQAIQAPRNAKAVPVAHIRAAAALLLLRPLQLQQQQPLPASACSQCGARASAPCRSLCCST